MKRSYLVIGVVTIFLSLMAWVWNMPDSYVVENEQEEVKTTVTNSNERNVKVVNTNNEENKKITEENLTNNGDDSNSTRESCIAITYLTYEGQEKSGYIEDIELEEFKWNDMTLYTFNVAHEMTVYENESLENNIGTLTTLHPSQGEVLPTLGLSEATPRVFLIRLLGSFRTYFKTT